MFSDKYILFVETNLSGLFRQIYWVSDKSILFLYCDSDSYFCQSMMLLRGGVVFQESSMRSRKHAPHKNTMNDDNPR